MRSEAAGAGLSIGQEGHAGAEDVIGEGAAVGVGGRQGSFSGGAAPGDYQRTDRLDMPSRPVGAPRPASWVAREIAVFITGRALTTVRKGCRAQVMLTGGPGLRWR